RQFADGVRGQFHVTVLVAECDVRVMIFAMCQPGDGVDECLRLVVVAKLECTGDAAVLLLRPVVGQFGHPTVDRGRIHGGGATFTGCAMLVGQIAHGNLLWHAVTSTLTLMHHDYSLPVAVPWAA